MDMLNKSPDFSLVLGGPLFQLLRKTHLAGDGLELWRKRVLSFAMLTWLPLLLLSSWGATTSSNLTFLRDLEVHARFLVSLPLLIGAELLVHQRMRKLVPRFLERQLVPEDCIGRFHSAISSALRWRNSLTAELLLIGFVYFVGVGVVWRNYLALDVVSWYSIPSSHGQQLTLAGKWYVYFSLPIFQFLLLRWYFRMIIWVRFLWKVSRMPLKLVPTHPDGVAGLGFLSATSEAFVPLVVAHGALLAGNLANRIFFVGAKLPEFRVEVALVAAFLVCMVLGPLLLFTPQLHRTKLAGLAEYGTLAQQYVREFDHKWIRGGAPADEPLVGSADIQSLADLGNSYQVVKSMRLLPFSRDSLIQLVGATLLPILPLALTMMPLEDFLKKLVGILF
jgi:hypothetical protein